MIVVFEHRLELIKTDLFIVVVVILFELSCTNLRSIVLSDQIKGSQVFKNCCIKLSETLLVDFTTRGIDFENELS